jgi:hypothetical protein
LSIRIKGETEMTINEIVSGNDSVAITGTAQGDTTLGVRGVGDSTGVQGIGKAWNGVEGFSDSTIGGVGVFGAARGSGTGVWGQGKGSGFGVHGTHVDGGTGVVGTSTKWVGVYGETDGVENGPAGVWGEHKGAGIGVKAISNTGVGLVAFSNGTAAVFQGDVEVTGDVELTGALAVAGVGFTVVLARLAALERQISDLAQQVAGVGDSGAPTISVSQPPGSKLQVHGSSFKPNAAIRIRLVVGVIGNEASVNTTSSGNGSFEHIFPVTGVASGTAIWVSATDGTPDPSDITGFRWSNTFMITFVPH